MVDWRGRRYWIVGAAPGPDGALAREVALALSRLGCEIVVSDGAPRGAGADDALEGFVATLPGRARALPLDATSPGSVAAAAGDAGVLHGLVHMAALHQPMGVRDWDADRAQLMAGVNFMGALACVGAVLPGMVERGDGHVVLAGAWEGAGPGLAAYHAAKAGVAALAEGLRADLRGTGVVVQLVRHARPAATPDPAAAAQAVVEHMGTPAFARRLPALPRWLARLRPRRDAPDAPGR